MRKCTLICAGIFAAMGAAYAAEGGGSVYPHGTENYMAGALPPPGVYGMVFGNVYRADRVNDQDGNNLNVPGFKVEANVLAPRLVWRPDTKVLGGDVVAHVIAPLVDLKVGVAGNSQSTSGLGDLTVGVGLGYHHSPRLHSVWALDAFLPTGDYDRRNLANLGRNYFAIEPVYAVTYVDPNGLNADVKLGYLFNRRNKDTDYRSGQEFHFDYAIGWGLGNGWTVGLGGYYRKQTTLDEQGGAKLANSKTSAMAMGPSIKYDSGKGWLVTAKWQKESHVKNAAQGEALWVKAVFPF